MRVHTCGLSLVGLGEVTVCPQPLPRMFPVGRACENRDLAAEHLWLRCHCCVLWEFSAVRSLGPCLLSRGVRSGDWAHCGHQEE